MNDLSRRQAESRQRADIVPLTQRVWATEALRILSTAMLLMLGAAYTPLPDWQLQLAIGYLGLTTALTAVVITRNREATVAALSLSLLVDAVYLQIMHHTLGHELAVDFAITAFLVGACLLGSFRTGLKLAAWQSLLMLLTFRAQEADLITGAAEPATMGGFVADLTLLWLVVLATAASAAVSERELRRRRYDAEALREFAVALHSTDHADEVAREMLRFVVDEVDGGRALICRRTDAGLTLVAGHRVASIPDGVPHYSTLLVQPGEAGGPAALALALDETADPWLAAAMPSAKRVIAVRLDSHASGVNGTFLVMEHAGQRGIRVERRVLTTVGHAAVTVSLALSRADLLERARRAAATDGLTGVLNRRSFDAELARLLTWQADTGGSVAMVMTDVDHFKKINDNHGHQVGDRVLQAVARTLSAVAGSEGIVARYGGEEFVVLLPGFDMSRAIQMAERMRTTLHSLDAEVSVTASFGVSAVPEDAPDATVLVKRADAALYRAKQTGRDRVAVLPDEASDAAVAPTAA